jgi:hypothetical protein
LDADFVFKSDLRLVLCAILLFLNNMKKMCQEKEVRRSIEKEKNIWVRKCLFFSPFLMYKNETPLIFCLGSDYVLGLYFIVR